VSGDENEVGTELPRPPARHAASHTERPRLVGGREHDAAADRNRPAAQARVKQLLDRGVKGVEVGVKNAGCGSHAILFPSESYCAITSNGTRRAIDVLEPDLRR
jgi:hypothetical protein